MTFISNKMGDVSVFFSIPKLGTIISKYLSRMFMTILSPIMLLSVTFCTNDLPEVLK